MNPFYRGYGGHIEVICGSMFSGKTEELIRRLRRALYAHQRVQTFKPTLDDRFGETEEIISHSDFRLDATIVRNTEEMRRKLDDRTEVLGIDEVQFFDESVVDFCTRQANLGRRVVVAGLDQDYRGAPFEPVPRLMAIAEYVSKTLAVCARCGAPANKSQRIVASEKRIIVGATDSYEARCRRCFEPELIQQLAIDLSTSSPPLASGDKNS